MKRIDWTAAEQAKLVAAIKDLAQNRRIGLPIAEPWRKPSLVLRLVKDSQVVLETSRRRAYLASKFTIAGFIPALVQAGVLNSDEAQESSRKKINSKDAWLNTVADERDAARAEVEALKTKLQAAEGQVVALRMKLDTVPSEMEVVKSFVADILKRAGGHVKPSIGSVINETQIRAMAPKPPVEPLPPAPEKKVLPKVLVLGPIREQAESLRKEFGELIDLKILAGDEAHRVTDSAAGRRVVVWSKFVSHSSYNNVPREQIVFASTFRQIQDELTKIAVAG